MADDASPLTPDFDPVRDVTLAGLRGLLGAVPAFGALIDSAVFVPLELAARKRDVEFLQDLVRRVRLLEDGLDGWDLDRIVSDAAFVAAVRKVTRAAEEEASDAKRRLLLNALCNAGSWGSEPALTRARFLELIVRLSELHVFLLRFFAAPNLWLMDNAPAWDPDAIAAGGVGSVLERFVFAGDPVWPEEVGRAVADLSSEGLTDLASLNATMTGRSLYNRRTTDRGNRFLAFVRDPD